MSQTNQESTNLANIFCRVAASSKDKDLKLKTSNKIEVSKIVGDSIGKKAIKAGIKKVSFDRNGYLYHGRVKSLADGAREAGLNF